MLGPSILFASAPVALAESIGAVRKPAERVLGTISLLVAVPAMAILVLVLGAGVYSVLTQS